MAELSLEKAIELTKLLEKHTYGQEEKKMGNDPRWITDKMPNEDGTYLATLQTEQGNVFVETIRVFNGKWETEKLNVLAWILAWIPLPPVYIPPKAEEPAEKKCENCDHFKNMFCMTAIENDGYNVFISSGNPNFSCGNWKPKE